jgi:hypothetical protein
MKRALVMHTDSLVSEGVSVEGHSVLGSQARLIGAQCCCTHIAGLLRTSTCIQSKRSIHGFLLIYFFQDDV